MGGPVSYRFLQRNTPYRGWCVRVKERRDDPHCQRYWQPWRHWSEPSRRCVLLGQAGPVEWLQFVEAPEGGLISEPSGQLQVVGSAAREKHMGPNPPVVPRSKSRIPPGRERVKEYVPPACVLPHAKLGNSTSGFAFANNEKFGPFKINCLSVIKTIQTSVAWYWKG